MIEKLISGPVITDSTGYITKTCTLSPLSKCDHCPTFGRFALLWIISHYNHIDQVKISQDTKTTNSLNFETKIKKVNGFRASVVENSKQNFCYLWRYNAKSISKGWSRVLD